MQVVPSDIDLADVEFNMANRFSRESILRSALTENVRRHYDYILLDAPPNLGHAHRQRVDRCRRRSYPRRGDTLLRASGASPRCLARLKLVKQKLNPDLEVAGILATRHDPRTSLGKEVIERLPSFELPVYKTVIHEAVRLAEAPSAGQTILAYDGKGPSAEQYRALAAELEAQR